MPFMSLLLSTATLLDATNLALLSPVKLDSHPDTGQSFWYRDAAAFIVSLGSNTIPIWSEEAHGFVHCRAWFA